MYAHPSIKWELISGGDLLELLNECNGCMTEPAAAFYYSQLLRGVLHMHAVGYCHRYVFVCCVCDVAVRWRRC